MWIDPEFELFMVLLTNRIYPKQRDNGFPSMRAAIADAVVEAAAGIGR